MEEIKAMGTDFTTHRIKQAAVILPAQNDNYQLMGLTAEVRARNLGL